INNFSLLNIIGFCNFNNYFDNERRDRICYAEYKIDDLTNIEYDEILISSYEYNFEINDLLNKSNPGKTVYMIYDNTSRSFLDVIDKLPSYKIGNKYE
ncbi:MAG: hypothetical protein K8R35_01950, partial [Bacteroidales bacterium]|nr:hypothetical protein [Bacteroidales bacterium]